MRHILPALFFAAFSACSGCGNRPPTMTLHADGEPCANDMECQSGLCFALKGEPLKCGRKCTTGCDAMTEVCTQLGFQRYGCVPKIAGLCRPCQTNDDCPYPADSCIFVGGQKVCGQDCSFDSSCPEGYRCGTARDFSMAEVATQCAPKSDTCDCTPDSLGQRINCSKANDAGTCLGVQVCELAGYGACSATTPGPEVCNGLDDDCDTRVDEDLGETTCGVGECQRTYANCAGGHDQMCTPGVGGTELCNERDDDCDGTVDNGFNKASVQFCGSCSNSCSVMNGTAACVDGGTCAIASCNAPFADCSAGYVDGCETNTSNTVTHCGACGRICSAANATSSCVNGGCQFTCVAPFVDQNRDAGDGCEFGCDFVNPDRPDLAFADSNCDGIDGDPTRAIFVDVATGLDSNAGTRAAPKRSIGAALLAADSQVPKKDVYVSQGLYAESVTLRAGVNVYGGYNAAQGWSRAMSNATLINSPTTTGVSATNIGVATEVQLVTVSSASASGTAANGDGLSSTGVLVVDSMGPVTLRAVTVNAGAGSPGAPGSDGQTGQPGARGGDASGATQGQPGGSPCGAPGGIGANAPGGASSGAQGGAGTMAPGGGAPAAGGSPGGSGSCSSTGSTNGGSAPAVTFNGGTGPGGPNGVPGPQSGMLNPAGLYTPASGGDGLPGFPGGGGGGGGSGGGTAHGHNLICTDCSSHAGGGGGGGGGGACGGGAGTGGRGGGGSFGVVAVSSNVTLDASRVTTGNGGRGGDGGGGAAGGAGGPPGNGAPGVSHSSSCSTRHGGDGASGSSGGQGGQGGGGSGGTGGPSICVLYKGTFTPSSTGGTTCMLGAVGQGGNGGLGGLGRAVAGSNGLAGVTVMAN